MKYYEVDETHTVKVLNDKDYNEPVVGLSLDVYDVESSNSIIKFKFNGKPASVYQAMMYSRFNESPNVISDDYHQLNYLDNLFRRSHDNDPAKDKEDYYLNKSGQILIQPKDVDIYSERLISLIYDIFATSNKCMVDPQVLFVDNKCFNSEMTGYLKKFIYVNQYSTEELDSIRKEINKDKEPK